MNRPLLLAQLSDPHIGAEWAPADPVAGLRAAVAAVRALPAPPDAVLVTGDLSDHATDAEYEQVRELLAPLGAPLCVLPGNHDDRSALRRHFGLPGTGDEPVEYGVDLGPLRLVVLDTTRPGEDDGALDGGRLDWLAAELAAAPEQPTLLAMHHPPLVTGVPGWDEFALAAADREALAAVVARHAQVRLLVAGHVHRPMTAQLAGRPVSTAGSTYVQMRADAASDGVVMTDEPASLSLHAVSGGELITHVHTVTRAPAGRPGRR
ncbi:MAG TPA: metallophosphoesterase [Solirubrobacteraceae bacterium]|jgi:3',5'-cyclic AMP phosphodiesterase CpdA